MEIPSKIHQGRNVKRFREMLGIKQEALAIQLGDDWHQKRVSLLEAKEKLEPELLSVIAKALNVPEEVILNFDEVAAFNYFNTFCGVEINHSSTPKNELDYCFNPLEKMFEVMEENKMLYERLLASEREKLEILKERPFQK